MRTLLTYRCPAICFSLLCILSAYTKTIESPAANPGEELYAILIHRHCPVSPFTCPLYTAEVAPVFGNFVYHEETDSTGVHFR